jgi:uncharacterized protein
MEKLGPGVDRGTLYSNQDFDFFYRGLEQKQLLVQKCSTCGRLRNPPGPACPSCHSLDWGTLELSGMGTVFSHTVHYHPPLPSFAVPHPVILAEMAEGIRMLGAADATAPQDIYIGAPVSVEFVRRGDRAGFRFRIAESSNA